MNGKAPDAFRTISEVAEWLGVNTHVLRFWESKFPQVKPVKRAGGRRYYRPADMELLGGIQQLLHVDGMTIKGVQKILREQGVRAVAAHSRPVNLEAEATPYPPEDRAAPPVPEAAPTPVAAAPVETPDVAPPEDEAPAEPVTAEAPVTAPPAAPPPVREPALVGGDRSPTEPNSGAMPLFSHHAPLRPSAPEPAPAPPAPVATPAEAAPMPVARPLPGRDVPLLDALRMLAPGQVPAAQLLPHYQRLAALRARHDMPQ